MKAIILSLLLGCVTTFAATPVSKVPTAAAEFDLNRANAASYKHNAGTVLRQAHTTAVGVWDYSQQGGTVGNHAVGISLPANAIIRNVFTDEVTNVTTSASGGLDFILAGASVGHELTLNRAASAWAAQQAGKPDGTVTNMVNPTVATSVLARITTGALTAGKVKIFVDYVVSE